MLAALLDRLRRRARLVRKAGGELIIQLDDAGHRTGQLLVLPRLVRVRAGARVRVRVRHRLASCPAAPALKQEARRTR